ncbi:unnamed protein product [Coffea canephora]|uniref:DH200=94 genomic scaffold, scaffold_701 n=2 Tax=Coffea TaxID=13442 RepID=A0A068VGG7_COFCA|nr:B3 domain-containing protein Os04g0386900-like [Coffea arabica]CDP19806.1 unnamed protein product [Coffea canephora]
MSEEGKMESNEKVDSSAHTADGEVIDVNVQDSEAKDIELHHDNDGLDQSLVDDELSPLSEEPFYHHVVSFSHVNKLCHMVFPSRLRSDLPSKTVPAVVTCRGKSWEMTFLGGSQKLRFEVQSWKRFASDNGLKVGDAIFWELMESSDEKVSFKVQIIRGDFPSELQAQVNGETAATPILIE